MPSKTMNLPEQRVRFVVAASRREKSMTASCEELGISRPTGLPWFKRCQQDGIAGMTLEPALDAGMFAGSAMVHDQVDLFVRGKHVIDAAPKILVTTL